MCFSAKLGIHEFTTTFDKTLHELKIISKDYEDGKGKIYNKGVIPYISGFTIHVRDEVSLMSSQLIMSIMFVGSSPKLVITKNKKERSNNSKQEENKWFMERNEDAKVKF